MGQHSVERDRSGPVSRGPRTGDRQESIRKKSNGKKVTTFVRKKRQQKKSNSISCIWEKKVTSVTFTCQLVTFTYSCPKKKKKKKTLTYSFHNICNIYMSVSDIYILMS